MIWLQWRLTIAPEDAERATELLLDNGCDGAQIDDTQILFDESEDATIAPGAMATIIGYTSGDDAQKQRRIFEAALRETNIAARLEMSPLDEADWANEWRENFPPLHIGQFLVVPTWEEIEEAAAEKILIRLDPGLAFGTGQHPTTQLCLELLPECLARLEMDAPRVLDLGCGSGLLSIAAAKLGARVAASDFDERCADATRENAERNDVEVRVIQAAGLDWLEREYCSAGERSFDLVVANLMSDLLIRLAPDLFEAVRAGGTLLVSGISAPRADEVANALQAAGFDLRERHQRDGETRGDWIERWAALVLEK